jgi:transcriptional regulator GlxA family with amidase domain
VRIAFVIFDDMTALDLVGIYDPVTRLKSMGLLPALTWDICAQQSTAHDDRGLQLSSTNCPRNLGQYEALIVPGGFGTRRLRHNPEFSRWLQTAAPCKLKVSVCTGALLLGAAGFLRGRTATTYPAAFEELREYCETVVDRRIVDDGDVITGGGVTSAIDVGLYLVERLAGSEARQRISRQMDYPYSPPADSILITDRPS